MLHAIYLYLISLSYCCVLSLPSAVNDSVNWTPVYLRQHIMKGCRVQFLDYIRGYHRRKCAGNPQIFMVQLRTFPYGHSHLFAALRIIGTSERSVYVLCVYVVRVHVDLLEQSRVIFLFACTII